jgi:hypothetical protein
MLLVVLLYTIIYYLQKYTIGIYPLQWVPIYSFHDLPHIRRPYDCQYMPFNHSKWNLSVANTVKHEEVHKSENNYCSYSALNVYYSAMKVHMLPLYLPVQMWCCQELQLPY